MQQGQFSYNFIFDSTADGTQLKLLFLRHSVMMAPRTVRKASLPMRTLPLRGLPRRRHGLAHHAGSIARAVYLSNCVAARGFIHGYPAQAKLPNVRHA